MRVEEQETGGFRQGWKFVRILLITGLVLLGSSAIGREESNASSLPAYVYLTPSSACRAGGTIDVVIKVGRVRDLYGVAYTLTFDPQVLRVVEGGVQQPLEDYIFAGREGDVWESEVTIDNGAGKVSYVATLTGQEGESGWGALSVITFEIIGRGTSDLQFDTMEDASVLSNSEAQPIDTMWYQGLIMAPQSCYELSLPLVID